MQQLYKNVTNSLHTSVRNLHKSHYETLNISKDSSAKQVKDAYIRLSKEYHPDRTQTNASQKKFVEITEAYRVLSKPDLRRTYDLQFASESYRMHEFRAQGSSVNDPHFWVKTSKPRSKYTEDAPYYGVKGVQRKSNTTIATLLVGLAVVGFVVQMLLIKYSATFHRDRLIAKSNEAAEALRYARTRASQNGNDLQLKLLQAKLVEDHGRSSTENDS